MASATVICIKRTINTNDTYFTITNTITVTNTTIAPLLLQFTHYYYQNNYSTNDNKSNGYKYYVYKQIG